MTTNDDGAFGLAALLAALAGWVDAVGLGISGKLFLSFMSGNTTDLAVSIAHRDWAETATIAAIIGLFVAGVAFGEIIEPWGGRRGPALVLAVEAVLLAAGAALHWPGVAVSGLNPLFPPVFAMGVQNATLRRAGGIGVGLTYVTGALVQIGRSIAGAVAGKGDLGKAAEYVALWLSLATGAGLGALALSISPLAALSAPAAAAAALAVIVALWP